MNDDTDSDFKPESKLKYLTVIRTARPEYKAPGSRWNNQFDFSKVERQAIPHLEQLGDALQEKIKEYRSIHIITQAVPAGEHTAQIIASRLERKVGYEISSALGSAGHKVSLMDHAGEFGYSFPEIDFLVSRRRQTHEALLLVAGHTVSSQWFGNFLMDEFKIPYLTPNLARIYFGGAFRGYGFGVNLETREVDVLPKMFPAEGGCPYSQKMHSRNLRSA